MIYYKNVKNSFFDNLEIEIKKIKDRAYLNLECAFDVETTSYIENNEKTGFVYIWMFGLFDTVFYGRTFDELREFFTILYEKLDLSDHTLICYVHNLAYDFQFFCKEIEILDMFSISERKPAKVLTDFNIEFRCSYLLSGTSLSVVAKNLKTNISKKDGDLDYNLIRHHETPLTSDEMEYCKYDILIILEYIKEQKELYGDNITRIPLTNTGRVRKYVRDECFYVEKNHKKKSVSKFKKYKNIIFDLKLDENSYERLKRAFQGGFTHANPFYVDEILKNVSSIDFNSSYPAVMCSEQFPMTAPRKLLIESIEELEKSFNTFCVLFEIRLTNVVNKINYDSYISESKCITLKNPEINNGRVFSADELVMTVTDIDYKIIKNVYSYDEIQIANVTGFRKNYLPKPILKSILDFYRIKTELKGVEGKETEYNLNKGMLNSIYGMCVTDPVKDVQVFSAVDGWSVEKVDKKEEIEKYNISTNRFLFYAWGIWVTAYARLNLWTGILNIKDDYVYSDTDSIKLLNLEKHKKYIDSHNKMIISKITKCLDFHKLDLNLVSPRTKEGIEKPLGVWEIESTHEKFKTLGAKRYLTYSEKDDFKLTVAGLSKRNGMEYIKSECNNNVDLVFNFFNNDMYIPANATGKYTHTYIDHEMKINVTDYLGNKKTVITKSGIHLEPCDFTLSISEQFNNFIANLKNGYVYQGVKFK